MKIRIFTPGDYSSIVAIHDSMNIIWPERPRTPEAWAKADHRRNPKCKHQRWVAVEGNRVVGFSSYVQHTDDYHPQRFHINVEVRSEYQRRGIGAALYDEVMNGLQAFDPRVLRADAFTNLPQGFSFLRQRGFYEAFRETPVHLEVNVFDPSPYAGLQAKLNAQGIVLKTLRELESDPGRDRKVHDLYWHVDQDVPREEAQIESVDFDEWLTWPNDPSTLPDAYVIAVQGDEYVGLRELGTYQSGDALVGGLMGVHRDYRDRGIGLAMQLHGITYAKEHGYRLIKDCTAIQNAPMQTLFNRLGYARDPEWQQCQKDIN